MMRASPRGLGGLLLGLALVGLCRCAPAPGPAPEMRPVGERAIRLHDGVPLAHFGPNRPPRVRVDGPPGDWALVLRHGEARWALDTSPETIEGTRFLSSTLPEGMTPPDGPLSLMVMPRGGGPALESWMIWWEAHPPGGLLPALERAVRAVGQRWPALEVAGWRHIAALDARLGRPTEAARALRLGARRARQLGQLRLARAAIEAAEAHDRSVGAVAGQAYGAYAQAGVALRGGELRAAAAATARTRRMAARAGLRSLVGYAAVLHAVIRNELGYRAEARAALDVLLPHMERMSPDLRGMFAGNRGWVLLEGLRREAFPVEAAEVAAAFEAAREAFADRPAEVANQHANLAALARLVGDRAALDRHIEAYDALEPGRLQLPGFFVGLLDGHRALLDGDAELALARFTALEARLDARVDDPVGVYRWQARLGQARAHRAAGRGAEALVAYRAALAVLERSAARTAVQGDRALFFAEHDEVFDEAFGAAIEAGDLAAAFRAADAARARVVRDLEVITRLGRLDTAQRAIWSGHLERYLALRAEYEAQAAKGALMAASRKAAWAESQRVRRAALQAAFEEAHDWLDRAAPVSPGGAEVAAVQARLAPDEGLWLAHRHDGRWHGFLVTADALIHRIDEAPVPALDVLPEALAHLALVGVPPAAAPPLWDRVSTAMWTHAGALRAAQSGEGPRVVLGDPDQTLPGARREAAAIAERLGARVLNGAAVDREAALTTLRKAAVVHFAGHGVLVPEAPWDAHLRLARGERLSLEDVLMARLTPRLVVLSSCEAGATAPLASTIGLSLADGFVAAGAGSVLAAEHPLPDAAALGLMERFYAAGGLERPAEALRRAALAARAAGDPQWSAFHLRGAR